MWIDAAMRGLTASSVEVGSVRGLQLLVPETVMFDGAEQEVVTAFEATLGRLQSAGATIRRAPVPLFAEIFELAN